MAGENRAVSSSAGWETLVKRWASIPMVLACTAISVPWLLSYAPEIGLALQRAFALVCHQEPARSFSFFGGSVAVCARCLGIYLGATVGLLVSIDRRVAWRCLIAAVTLSLFDWIAESAGLHGNWMFSRFLLGFALGMTAAMMIASAPMYERVSQTKEA